MYREVVVTGPAIHHCSRGEDFIVVQCTVCILTCIISDNDTIWLKNVLLSFMCLFFSRLCRRIILTLVRSHLMVPVTMAIQSDSSSQLISSSPPSV